eukprot:1185865-Prorocentrum_minimum.AAC.4
MNHVTLFLSCGSSLCQQRFGSDRLEEGRTPLDSTALIPLRCGTRGRRSDRPSLDSTPRATPS